MKDFKANRKSPQPTESKDDAEVRRDFWSIQGDFIYRDHNEPRVQLYVPKEETFPIPLKYIDVTRSTHTNLDVMQVQRTDDNSNVDENRSSDSWIGFTKFVLLKEEPSKGYMWSGRKPTKDQPITTNGFNLNHKNLSGDGQEFEPSKSRKSNFILTIHSTLANPVKTYHGIIARQNVHGSDTSGTTERAVRSIQVGTSMVGCFHGLWQRTSGRWENTL